MSTTEKVSLLLFLLAVAAVYTAEFILVILALYDKFSSGRNPTFFFSKPVVVLQDASSNRAGLKLITSRSGVTNSSQRPFVSLTFQTCTAKAARSTKRKQFES